MIDIQGRELHFGVFIRIMVKISLRFNAYESISFKLGAMISMKKCYILIPINDLTFTQGHRLMRKL